MDTLSPRIERLHQFPYLATQITLRQLAFTMSWIKRIVSRCASSPYREGGILAAAPEAGDRAVEACPR